MTTERSGESDVHKIRSIKSGLSCGSVNKALRSDCVGHYHTGFLWPALRSCEHAAISEIQLLNTKCQAFPTPVRFFLQPGRFLDSNGDEKNCVEQGCVRMPRQSFWSGLVVVGFALLTLNWIIPTYAGTMALAAMPPDLLPRIAAWIMLVCGAIVVVHAAIELRRQEESVVSLDIDWRAFGWAVWPFLYVTASIYILIHFKITYVGAPIIAGLLFLLGERRWPILIGCSAVPVFLLYVLSVYLMRVGVV